MIVGLKESIPCDQAISGNNNYRNYLNERGGTDLIFYLSEGVLIREREREEWGSFKLRCSLNFLAVKTGAHLKGAFIKAGALFQIITVMLPGLEMSYLNTLMPRSNCSRGRFISHSKLI